MTAPSRPSPDSGPVQNTDRHLWPQVSEEENAPRLFATAGGGIGIDVGGHVIVKPLRDWHALARASQPATPTVAEPQFEPMKLQAQVPDGEWIDIFPAQLEWMAKDGKPVRAIEAPAQCSAGRESAGPAPIDPEIARAAAEQANKLFGQWMPERWLNLFIDSYDDIAACRWTLADMVLSDAPAKPPIDRNAIIEECAKIAEQNYALMFTKQENRDTARKVSAQIVTGIRGLLVSSTEGK